jgi:hypothetical protein
MAAGPHTQAAGQAECSRAFSEPELSPVEAGVCP